MKPTHRLASALTGTVLLLPAMACYTYEPLRPGEIPTGAEVRARVTAEEAERLVEVFGREDRLIEGTVLEDGSDRLLLQVPVVSGIERRGETLSQRLELARSEVLEVELKRLDQLRTGSLLAVVVGAGVYLLVSQLEGGRAGDPPDLPPPTEMRFPIRIPLPWGSF